MRGVEVISREEILVRSFFRWVKVRFRYDRFDGTDSGTIEHLVLDRGDSVAVLLHDCPNDKVVIVEQVRIATGGWLLELPAGKVDAGEPPDETAKREAVEETGIDPSAVQLIASFYLSPGACSERLHLFYCPFDRPLEANETGGLASESEDIRIHLLGVDEAMSRIADGRICDAKTIVGLYWLITQRSGAS